MTEDSWLKELKKEENECVKLINRCIEIRSDKNKELSERKKLSEDILQKIERYDSNEGIPIKFWYECYAFAKASESYKQPFQTERKKISKIIYNLLEDYPDDKFIEEFYAYAKSNEAYFAPDLDSRLEITTEVYRLHRKYPTNNNILEYYAFAKSREAKKQTSLGERQNISKALFTLYNECKEGENKERILQYYIYAKAREVVYIDENKAKIEVLNAIVKELSDSKTSLDTTKNMGHYVKHIEEITTEKLEKLTDLTDSNKSILRSLCLVLSSLSYNLEKLDNEKDFAERISNYLEGVYIENKNDEKIAQYYVFALSNLARHNLEISVLYKINNEITECKKAFPKNDLITRYHSYVLYKIYLKYIREETEELKDNFEKLEKNLDEFPSDRYISLYYCRALGSFPISLDFSKQGLRLERAMFIKKLFGEVYEAKDKKKYEVIEEEYTKYRDKITESDSNILELLENFKTKDINDSYYQGNYFATLLNCCLEKLISDDQKDIDENILDKLINNKILDELTDNEILDKLMSMINPYSKPTIRDFLLRLLDILLYDKKDNDKKDNDKKDNDKKDNDKKDAYKKYAYEKLTNLLKVLNRNRRRLQYLNLDFIGELI